MTHNVFFISDTHFGHRNLINFKDDNGNSVRPFHDIFDMDESLIFNWNLVVRPHDKIYHLGDVALQSPNLNILQRLNGNKILIKGNHDKMQLAEYAKYFKDVRGVEHRREWKFMLSHVPVHPDSIKEGWINVHGHLHGRTLDDPRYFNVSVERINYTPIELSELQKAINENIRNVG